MVIHSNINDFFCARNLCAGASRLVIGSVFVFAAAGSLSVEAQTAAPAATLAPDTNSATTTGESATDTIVVTGFRASVLNSIRTKKFDSLIVESVTAEDVGKLPDVSIAESIARLPGLTAQRFEGRGSVISIRGLGPEFSTALLNGRPQVTTGDNRGIEFDQYPSEVLNEVVVYKTSQGGLIGAGLSGTVDLRSIRPLAQKGRLISLQARGEFNAQDSLNPDAPNKGYRFSATYVDKFADDTLGVSLGFSAIDNPTQNARYTAWGGGFYPSDPNGNFILGGAKPYGQSDDLTRYGVIGTIEWKPNDRFHSSLDVFYSNFTEVQRLRGIEFPFYFDVQSATNPTGVAIANVTAVNGLDTQVTFNNVTAVQRNDYNRRDANTISIGWNGKYNISNGFDVSLDLSWSRAKRRDFLLESYSGTGYQFSGVRDSVTITRQPSGIYSFATTLNYADTNIFRLTDPRGWGGNAVNTGARIVQAGFYNAPNFKDELGEGKINFTKDIGYSLLKNVDFGLDFGRRSKTSRYTSYFLQLPNGATEAPVPQAALLGRATPLGYLGITNELIYDPIYLLNNLYVPLFDNRPDSLARDYQVQEDVYTGYVRVNLEGEVASLPVKGNFGFDVISTDQSSVGPTSRIVPNTTGPGNTVVVANISGSAGYTYFLPSLNINVEPLKDLHVRFSASRTQARAQLDQLRVSQTINLNRTNLTQTDPGRSAFSASGGNINLRPYFSNNYDLSFEKYFGSAGYVSVALFYKTIDNFVNPARSFLFDFRDAVSSFLTPAEAATLGTTLGVVSGPDNGGSGEIKGVEGTLSVPLSLATKALDGFGLIATGSYTDSSIRYTGFSQNLTVPGLSKFVTSVTGYWEKYGFQARVSYRYRSSFLGIIAGLSAAQEFRNFQPEGIVDAQIGYSFTEGYLKGLNLLIQGQNLNDEPYATSGTDPRLIAEYQKYGRTFLIGATYKF